MTGALRVSARVAVVSALVVGSAPWGGVGRADDVRTDTKLAGFAVSVEATPLRVLLDDPKLEVPHDPGTAVLEGDPNYTLASVKAGPNARAITSTLWPGNLLGEGLAQVAPNAPAYPVKGEARYPDKPFTANGPDGGQLGGAEAQGLYAHATAEGAPTDKPGQVVVGAVSSVSTATVDDKDVAIGTAVSAVKDVDLLGGILHLGAVTTKVLTQSDGKKTAASGATTVSGLTIAGQAFSVDDKGLHAAGNGQALPGLGTPSQLADTLGISGTLFDQTTVKTANGVNRVAGGLVLKVDTAPLRKLLAPVTGVVNPVLNGLISQLPPDQQGNLYYLVKATPNITFVFGSANAGSAATLPLKLTFPGFGGNPFPPAPGGGSAPGPGLAPGGSSTPPIGSVDIPPGAIAPPIVDGQPLAPSASGPVLSLAGNSPAGGFEGIGAAWIGLAVAASALIGWGLLRLLGLTGGLLGIGCRLGAPTSVPDLRSVTA